MNQSDQDQARCAGELKLQRVQRVVWWSDRIVLLCIALPIALLIQFRNGGWSGLGIGFAAGFGAWLLYAVGRTLVLIGFARRHASEHFDQDVIAIHDHVARTSDCAGAARQLEQLIDTRGESYQRLVSLAEMLCHEDDLDRALSLTHRAKELDHAASVCSADLIEAECLRRMGRFSEAHDITSHVVSDRSAPDAAYVVHAKVLAELGRFAEAERQLGAARRQSRSLLSRFVGGRTYRLAIENDLHEAERLLADLRQSASSAT